MVIPASGAKAGTVTAYQFYNAVMYSHARTTTNIWAALQQPGGPAAHAMRSVMPQVQHLYELYQLLAQGRKKRGAIDFDTVETKIVCNELGRIEQIAPSVRNDAHKLIEECMLAANTCAADFMTRSKHPGLYRIHEGPTPERLQSLREFLRTMGLSTLGGAKRPRPGLRRLPGQRARPSRLPAAADHVPALHAAGHLQPGQSRPLRLAYPGYSHFTSPIRRYPDLLTHRVIKALLAGQRYVPSGRPRGGHRPHTARARARHLGKTGPDAVGLRAARRRSLARRRGRLKCWFVKERVGEDFSGTVTGVASFGIFVTLDTLHVEGLVHVSELGGEYFQFNDALHELRGERTGMRYRLTDKVQVQVSRVDRKRAASSSAVQGTSFDALRKAAARGGRWLAPSQEGGGAQAGGPEGPDRQGAPRRGQEGRPARQARGGEKPKR